MQLVGWGVVLGIVGGILLNTYVHYEHHVEASNDIAIDTLIEPEPREVRLVAKAEEINWTPERIAQEIDKVFPNAPIMHDVMRCESGGDIEAYNPTNGSHDNGLFQISDYYHGPRVRALGLDVGDPADNIAFARILYDERGLQPWSASKHCWNS